MDRNRGGKGRKTIYFTNRTSNMNATTTSSLSKSTKDISNEQRHNNNSCKEIKIVLTLDANSQAFFTELRNMWNMLKKSRPVINFLYQHLNVCQNPFEQVLRLIYNCQEFNNAKTKTLPFFIIEEFKLWLSYNRNKIIHLLTPQLKIDAFKIISKQHTLTLTKLVVEVYEMTTNPKIFLNIINCMIEEKKYKEACQSVMLLGLQDQYSNEEFLLPLIAQDKLVNAEEFLITSPKHQKSLVACLDSFLASPQLRDEFRTFFEDLKVPDVKLDKFHPKPLKKLLTRLVKMFKLSNDLTPNLNRKRNEGALQFLLHKRFIENGFSAESFREMVQEAVGNDKELQKELISYLSMYDEISEALHWAKFYNIDRQYWPYSVLMLDEDPTTYRQQKQQQKNNFDEDNWVNDQNQVQNNDLVVDYHKLLLDFDKIRLVDSANSFRYFLETGLQDVDLVGIDCEWKPSFDSQKNELALMQIATRKNVFILDIIKIGSIVPHLWQELGHILFNNCDILKLGFSFTSDFTMIKHSLPGLNFSHKQVGFLDLLTLWKRLIEKHNPKINLPYEVQSGGPSLTTLVKQCLGRPLDKSDQFSNWEKRPLRNKQLIYAALDSYCLIEVYDILKQCTEQQGYLFDEICYNVMTNEKMPKKKIKKTNKKKSPTKLNDNIGQPPSPHLKPIPANTLKIICDTMLQGLSKKLRKCGIDSIALENYTDHMECLKYYENEGRYILSSGIPFKKLFGYVPHGHCLKIISENIDEQLKEVIDYYKVIITKDDVFSRCQKCNSNNFVELSLQIVLQLIKQQYTQLQYTCDADEATGFSSDDEEFDFEPGAPIDNHLTNRHWQLDGAGKINLWCGQTKSGAKIDVASIPDGILKSVQLFYVCENCGKIYWDGSHLNRILDGSLKGIVQ